MTRRSNETIKSKPDGGFVAVLPDGRERPYIPPEVDWAALDAMTDEEVEAAALADPDNPPLTEEQLARCTLVRRRT
jgi:putative transcriptional regulator